MSSPTSVPDDDSIVSGPGGAVQLIAPGGQVDREALFALYESSGEFDDDNPVSVTFELTRDLEKRLDRYLVDRVPFLSRTQLQRLIDEEAVTVNGRIPKASTKLRKGDRVVAMLPPPPSSEIPAEDIPVRRAEPVRTTQATTPAQMAEEEMPVRRAEPVVPLQPFDADTVPAAGE